MFVFDNMFFNVVICAVIFLVVIWVVVFFLVLDVDWFLLVVLWGFLLYGFGEELELIFGVVLFGWEFGFFVVVFLLLVGILFNMKSILLGLFVLDVLELLKIFYEECVIVVLFFFV